MYSAPAAPIGTGSYIDLTVTVFATISFAFQNESRLHISEGRTAYIVEPFYQHVNIF